MDVLNLSQRMHDELRRDGCGNASEQEENRFQRVVWSNYGTIIGLVGHDDGFFKKCVPGPCAIVSTHEVVVCLALDCFKGAEEYC